MNYIYVVLLIVVALMIINNEKKDIKKEKLFKEFGFEAV